MDKISISLAIITLNEEENIGRCIKSASLVDEVVVIDSFSQDRTKEIAENLGAKVIENKWLGFEKQKQLAVDSCQNDWVLSLDADEELSQELINELQRLLQNVDELESYDAYKIPRLSWHFNRWIRHGGWYPDYQVRLFNRKRASWAGGDLHEFIKAEKVGKLHSNIQHYVFKDLSQQVQVNDRYSSLGAKTLIGNGKRFSVLQLLFRPLGKFIETYFIKRGFLDGLPGFIISVGAAYSLFLRYAKVYEHQLNQDTKSSMSLEPKAK